MKKELGITLSVGVSFNKTFAKLGSDMKKPDAITVIRRSEFKEKIWNLPACDMLWVGRSTYKTLKRYGILTIGDIAKTSVDTLVSLLGKNGELLWKCANGYENFEVSDFLSTPEIKSVGRGITLVSDITENDEIYRVILSLSHEVSRELRKHRLSAGGVQISVKSNELKSVQFQKKTNFLTQNAREISDLAFSLFDERYDRELPVRAISVRAFDLLESNCAVQLDMFFDIEKHIKREKIEKAMLSINQKYGKNTVKEATLFCDTKMPKAKPIASFCRSQRLWMSTLTGNICDRRDRARPCPQKNTYKIKLTDNRKGCPYGLWVYFYIISAINYHISSTI